MDGSAGALGFVDLARIRTNAASFTAYNLGGWAPGAVASGNLWYDADGSGAGAAVLFASFGAGETLTAADFVIVA